MLAFFNHIGEIFKKKTIQRVNRILTTCLFSIVSTFRSINTKGGLHYEPRETFLCLFGVQKKVS